MLRLVGQDERELGRRERHMLRDAKRIQSPVAEAHRCLDLAVSTGDMDLLFKTLRSLLHLGLYAKDIADRFHWDLTEDSA